MDQISWGSQQQKKKKNLLGPLFKIDNRCYFRLLKAGLPPRRLARLYLLIYCTAEGMLELYTTSAFYLLEHYLHNAYACLLFMQMDARWGEWVRLCVAANVSRPLASLEGLQHSGGAHGWGQASLLLHVQDQSREREAVSSYQQCKCPFVRVLDNMVINRAGLDLHLLWMSAFSAKFSLQKWTDPIQYNVAPKVRHRRFIKKLNLLQQKNI